MKKFFKGHETEKESARSATAGEQALQHLDDSVLHAATGGVHDRKVVIATIGTPPPPIPPPGHEEAGKIVLGDSWDEFLT